MKLSALPRVIRTSRHLRLSQIVARLRRLTGRDFASVQAAPEDAVDRVDPSLAEILPALPPVECTGEHGIRCLQQLEQGDFRHLNETVRIGTNDPDWRLGNVSANRLWTVTLHYHQWLFELATVYREGTSAESERAARLVYHYLGDWLAKCDLGMPGADALAGNSYAIATRLGWWTRAYHTMGPEFRAEACDLVPHWTAAMWRQAAHLARHLEWDLRANHLLRDAVGLAWAGRFFQGDQPRRWLATATAIAVGQAREQVLDDGGHFERSPMYHLEVLDDFRVLAFLLRDEEAKSLMDATCLRMADFAAWMQHPDGDVPQFNDAARRSVIGTLSTLPATNADASASRRRGGHFFEDFGMVVWHGEPWSLFFDVGSVGPDYQPGHAHADTLSLELSHRGQRVFIDPGCHGYDNDDRRRYDRSTDAHNTVCIDGHDSSEVWHIFRVGRRETRIEEVDLQSDGLQVTASHTGYDHLPGHPRHTRQLDLREDGRIEIIDRVAGKAEHTVSGGLLVAPDWSVESTAGGWALRCGGQKLVVQVEGPAEMRLTVEPRPCHPDFGIELPTQRIRWSYAGPLPIQVVTVIDESAAKRTERRSRVLS